MILERFDVALSRHAFGPRDRARAGHVWRLLQDVAIEGSARRGWPPARYAEIAGSFIVRRMRVVHAREIRWGEPLAATTWVSTFRRGTFSDRQLRLHAAGEPVVRATQQWVFVRLPRLEPGRAPDPLVADFGAGMPEGEADVALPAAPEAEAGAFTTRFGAWHTAMDPLGHANHPAYVDWAEEALARWLAAAGHDPQAMVPVAEEIEFRSGVVAPEDVVVELTVAEPASESRCDPPAPDPRAAPPHPTPPPAPRLPGWEAGGDLHVRARIRGGDGRLCAEGRLIRRRAPGG